MPHKLFIAFLIFVSLSAVVAVLVRGYGYYLEPMQSRPFRSDYQSMRPSGTFSHGLGIIGSAMMTIGVVTYSSRKRIRRLWKVGKISSWLEFHIFLCLLGPTLVIFHTTFKAGGIAAVSLWSMLSVAGSGLFGRYLYSQMPHSLRGVELSDTQIKEEIDRLGTIMASNVVGKHLIKEIDGFLASIPRPENIGQSIRTFSRLFSARKQVRKFVNQMLWSKSIPRQESVRVYEAAVVRTELMQKSIVLSQIERLFNYWHIIHLPFSIIMFITLIGHVVVTILLGYHWIF